MAYTIPVVALVVDDTAAAALIGEAPDYFQDYDNDRYDGLERLCKATKAPIRSFSNEDGDIYYIGIEAKSDWYVKLDAKLLAKEADLKARYPHALIQTASLAVVSQFC